jgi:hypothetical protein
MLATGIQSLRRDEILMVAREQPAEERRCAGA